MTADMINGVFELVGGLFLVLNVRRLYIDKQMKGVSLTPVVFFTAWGFWNLFFYPAVGAWYSFYGGMLIAVVNTAWIVLAVRYTIRPRLNP